MYRDTPLVLFYICSVVNLLYWRLHNRLLLFFYFFDNFWCCRLWCNNFNNRLRLGHNRCGLFNNQMLYQDRSGCNFNNNRSLFLYGSGCRLLAKIYV